jgi:hypothetical protein
MSNLTPPAPPHFTSSPPASPRSPPRKRRSGTYTHRSTMFHGQCPQLAPHFPPIEATTLSRTSPAAMHALAAFQWASDRKCAITGTISLILDTGASVSVTGCIGDFKHPPKPVQCTTLHGIASGLVVQGVGTTTYTVLDNEGAPVTLNIPGTLYVPKCPSRLLCPRQILATDSSGQAACTVTTTGIDLTLHGKHIAAPYHATHQLPTLHTAPSIMCFQAFCRDNTRETTIAAISGRPGSLPVSLSLAQRIKLQWHQRLNHINFDQLHQWMRQGKIKVSPEVISSPIPVCSACAYGKAKRRPHTICTSPIDSDHSKPGDGVSADQLEAGCPGIIPTAKGSPISTHYLYCNVWVDHHSRFIFLTMHQRKDAREMLQSKQAFEAFCRRHGVNIRRIRADNGVYTSQLFRASCDSQAQQLTFCGVGSHWQNGIAERCIGSLQAAA